MSKPCRFCTAPTHAGLFCCRNCWSRLPDPSRHAVYLARAARCRLEIDDDELAQRWDEIEVGMRTSVPPVEYELGGEA